MYSIPRHNAFDYQKTFQNQVNYIRNKCMKALNIMKFLCGCWWGCSPETLITIHKSYIRAIIDFGCFIYFHKSRLLIEKLERLQYSAIRTALGYRISTPTHILVGESKLLLLADRARQLCCCFLTKVCSDRTSETGKIVKEFYERYRNKRRKRNSLFINCILDNNNTICNSILTNDNGIYAHAYDVVIATIPVNLSFGEKMRAHDRPDVLLEQFIDSKDAIAVFTDGSKITGSPAVGAAVVCPKLNFHNAKALSPNASIFSAEAMAIGLALDVATEHRDSKFVICSDSLSVLLSLKSL